MPHRPIRLAELLDGLAVVPAAATDLEIAQATADSRAVGPGTLFAALAGEKAHGRDYVPAAAGAGAVAVLTDDTTLTASIPVCVAENPRRAYALACARLHGGAQPGTVAAVTGTNGKTSVVSFTRQIWAKLGLAAAQMGTIGTIAPGRPVTPTLTTMEPAQLHAELAALAADGVTHLALEASSHGLDQHRLDGVTLAAVGFTNLTRDHLDYHGDMERYFAAKAALFARLAPAGAAAVIHKGSDRFDALARIATARGLRTISYGAVNSGGAHSEGRGADLALIDRRPDLDGQDLILEIFGVRREVRLPLAGGFQAENALCALGFALGCGADQDAAVAALATLEGAPGRLQRAATTSAGGAIYVDYAHTPDALATALAALRPHTTGRLVVVFGCGGDRDPGKRPMMGEIAVRLADRAIVADDNPRTEDAASIRAQILAACGGRAEEIGDRLAAIRAGAQGLAAGDLLVIAGKGHEQGQIVGKIVLPFDDVTAARTVAAEGVGAVALAATTGDAP